jgi:hypothetical protein
MILEHFSLFFCCLVFAILVKDEKEREREKQEIGKYLNQFPRTYVKHKHLTT